MDQLKAAGPADGVDAVLHVALLQLPALTAQHLHHLQGGSGIFQLMPAQQGQGVQLPLVCKALAIETVKLAVDLVKVGNAQAGAQGGAALPHYVHHALLLLVKHAVTAGLDDSRLLGGDLFHRVPQDLGVVQADIHDHRGLRRSNDIGGVQPAAQSRLQHHNVALFLLKPQESGGGHHLKLRGVILHCVGGGLHQGHHLCQSLIPDGLAVDLHPLIEAGQIGGGEKAGAVAAAFHHRGEHGGAAALAVGAGNVDELQGILGAAQLFQQRRDPRKPRLGAQPGDAVDIFQSFLIIHIYLQSAFSFSTL